MTVLNLCAHYVGRFKRGYEWTIHPFLFFCLFSSLCAVSANEINLNSFEVDTILKLSWDDVGFKQVPGKNLAPESFDVFDNSIYLLDSVNNRVAQIDLAGNIANEMPLSRNWASDVCVSETGFFVFFSDSNEINKYTHLGDFVNNYVLPITTIVQGSWSGLRCQEQLIMESSGGFSFIFDDEKNEFISTNGWLRKGQVSHVSLQNSQLGNITLSQTTLSISQENLMGLSLLNLDKDNNAYVLATEATKNSANVYALKYNTQGLLISKGQLPYSNYAYTFRNMRLTKDGQIIQILPTPEGLNIILWVEQPYVSRNIRTNSETEDLFQYQNIEGQVIIPSDPSEINARSTRSETNGFISRAEIIQNAELYLNSVFRISSTNTTTGAYCDRKIVKTPPNPIDQTFTGMPYGWGRWSTPSEFKEQLAGKFAGDTSTDQGFGSTCVVGIDCSGFVSRAWNINRNSTRTLPNVSSIVEGGTRQEKFNNIRAGDIVNDAGIHVRLFVARNADGSFQFIESTPPRVQRLSYPYSKLNTYTPLRYKNVQESQIKLLQFNIAPHALTQSESSAVKFTLQNEGSTVTVEDTTVAIVDSQGNNKGDLVYTGQYSFGANTTKQVNANLVSNFTKNLPIGEYDLIAKVKQNGQWLHVGQQALEIWTEDMATYAGQSIIRSDSEMFKDERRNTFIAILMRALEKRAGKTLTEAATSQFTDVPADALQTEILKAEQLGIIAGGGSGLFYPTRTISRVEALAFTVRTFEALARKIIPQCKPAFADFPTEDNKQWMHEVMQKGYSQYITSGYGSGDARVFKPEETVNRLEAVAFVENLITQLTNSIKPREESATTCWDAKEQDTNPPPVTTDPEVTVPTTGTDLQRIASVLFQIDIDKIDDSNLGANYSYNVYEKYPSSVCGYQGGHSGLDIQTKDVAGAKTADRNFYAVSSGTVVNAGSDVSKTIAIYDADKDITVLYLHAKSTNVRVDQTIKVGDLLGIQGMEGFAEGEHVHLEVRTGSHTVGSCGANSVTSRNPVPYLIDYLDNTTNIAMKVLDKQIGKALLTGIQDSELGSIKVEGQTLNNLVNTQDGIQFNIGINQNEVTKPLNIVVFDKQGTEVLNTYYPFTDVPSDAWFAKAAIQLWKLDIMNGIDGQFLQGKEIKRSEFIKISVLAKQLAGLLDAAKIFPEQSTDFSDVTSEHWASGYIQYAKDAQIVNDGGSDKRFRPNDSLTRAEAAKVATKSFEFQSIFSWFNQALKKCPSNFTDLDNGVWYCPYIAELYRLNIMRGS
ncbi:MAG: S-layer homology domain-containing protein, partial [Thiotrichaceae bacterium]|nr:S-layer homology domain-containing protein [Thiotrichaceae bacterium]